MDASRHARPLLTLSAALAAAILTGCAGQKSPTFRVAGASLGPQTADHSVILVTIEGENPNPDPLPLYSVRYRATVGEGAESAVAERSPERTIPRFGRTSFTVPVVVANGRLAGPVERVEFSGTIVYQVPGTIAEVFFDNDIRRPSARITGETSVLVDATVAP